MTNAQVRFGPRESRGWLLGMTTPQLLLSIVAGYTATKIFDADITAVVRLAWIALATISLTVAFAPLRGRNIVEYVPVVANYWAQRLTGHESTGEARSDSPTTRTQPDSCCPATSPAWS